jgi:hypothetical protein
MTDAKLYLNGIEAVGANLSRIEINYEAGDLVGVIGQFFAVSTEFELPIEDNLAALQFAPGNLSLKTYPTVAGDAQLLVNGADVLRLNGRYRLLGMNRVRGIARVSVIGNNSNYASTLAGRRMRDLDLSAYDDPYNPQTIGDYTGGLWQPIIQSGRNSLTTLAITDYFYPSLDLNSLIEKVCEGIDRTALYGSFGAEYLYNRVYLFPVGGLMRNGQRWLTSIEETRALPDGGISGSGSLAAGISHSNSTTLVPGTIFSPENGGPCRIDYSLTANITSTPTGAYTEFYSISIEYGGFAVGQIVATGDVTGAYTGSFYWNKPFPNGSDTFFASIQYSITATGGGGGCTYNYNINTPVFPVFTLSFVPLEGYNTDVATGTTLNFEAYLPDWDQRKFMEECARLAGCVVVEDVEAKTIGFFPMQRLVEADPFLPALPVTDWTDIVIATSEGMEIATFDVDGVGQATRFTYVHDDDTKPYTFADYTVVGNEILPPLVSYDISFADSAEGAVAGGTASLIPYWEPNEDNTSFTARSVSPRILYRPNFISRDFDGPFSTTDYGTFQQIEGEVYGLPWNTLVRSFYTPLSNFAAEPVTIDIKVLLSATDILQLFTPISDASATPRILCPVFIGGQIGAKFKIKSINFVPNSEIQIATLIRL